MNVPGTDESRKKPSTRAASSRTNPKCTKTRPRLSQMDPNSAPFVPRSASRSKPLRAKKTPDSKPSDTPKCRKQRKKRRPRQEKKKDKYQFLGNLELIEDHHSLSAEKIQMLSKGTYECIVCMDPIRRQQPIWHHPRCFGIFHYECILKWAKQPLPEGSKDTRWRCPFCNTGVSNDEPESWCFCMKTKRPDFNPYVTPHSCGELCGKVRLGTPCKHPCTLPCHPGPCPPCERVSPVYHCFCGKTEYTLKCSEVNPGRSCGAICDRLLSCGRHHCKETCHAGECKPCDLVITQTCYCGTSQEERVCGTDKPDWSQGEERHFSCEDSCERPYACGNHVCLNPCHPGDCGPCPLLPENIRTCPCGKRKVEEIAAQRTSCLDPIPTCGSTCNKLLHCGVHRCTLKCHLGPCPACSGNIRIPCRCGSAKKRFPCQQVHPPPGAPPRPPDLFLCKRTCRKLRSCGKHQCGIKCCPASTGTDPEGFHVCTVKCPKTLNCGIHKCEMYCHKGPCQPCYRNSYEELACACGKTIMEPPIPCGTPPPECPYPCTRESSCEHPIGKHQCHYKGRCPPCVVLVSRPCMGGHQMMDRVPCHLKDVSCGGPCDKLLPCGQHTCERPCHKGSCTESTRTDVKYESCGKPCGLPLETCEHTCIAVCHPGEPCPPIICKQQTTIYCPCRHRSERVLCLRGRSPSGEVIEPEERVLECNEDCKREARRRKLQDAFGDLQRTPSFSEELVSIAASRPRFLYSVEAAFKELVEGTSATYSFPPMKVAQRQVIHELAEFYNIDTRSYDFEPMRSVTAMRRPTTKMPSQLLSDFLKDRQARHHRTQMVSQGNNRTNAARAAARSFAQDSRRTFVLHVYQLTAEVKTHDLVEFLSPFAGKFTIKWLDAENALAIFSRPPEPETVLSVLSIPREDAPHYKVKLSEEHEKPPAWLRTRRDPRDKGTQKTKSDKDKQPGSSRAGSDSILAMFEEDDEWRETPNPFGLLSGGEETATQEPSFAEEDTQKAEEKLQVPEHWTQIEIEQCADPEDTEHQDKTDTL